MAKQESTPFISMTERITNAASEIVAMHTRLPLEEARFLCDKAGRLSARELGLPGFPGEETPLEVKYAFARYALELLVAELEARRFDRQVIKEMREDIDTFYRNVRRIPPHD
jgi:hypothetical protein